MDKNKLVYDIIKTDPVNHKILHSIKPQGFIC